MASRQVRQVRKGYAKDEMNRSARLRLRFEDEDEEVTKEAHGRLKGREHFQNETGSFA